MNQPAAGAPATGFRLRTAHLFLLLPWIAVGVASRQAIRDNSFLWHVRAGTLQLDAQEVLRTDPFSFTFAGAAWRTQSWLADLAYGALERTFGHDLGWVAWLNAVVFGLTLVLLGRVVYRRCASVPATAVGLFLLGWLAIPYINPRPVAFSFLGLAALIAALDLRVRWAQPLLIWIWAAVHGSFVIGIGLIVLDAVRRRDGKAATTVALSVITASLTAHGLALWGVLAQFSQSRDALDLITEWQPPNLTSIPTLPYAALILLVLFGASRGSVSTRDLWVVAPFLLFGLTSARAVMVGAIVVLPFAAAALAEPIPARPPRSGSPTLLVGVLGAVMVALPFVLAPEAPKLDATRFPVAAADSLTPDPTFHGDGDGGYLIFDRWPEQPIFVDDRAELYGGEFFQEFVDARAAVPGWEDLFTEWEIRQALLRPDAPLAGVLADHADWAEVYRDDDHVVLRRRS